MLIYALAAMLAAGPLSQVSSPATVHILVDPARAPREGVVASLEGAVAAAEHVPGGTTSVEIEIVPGTYELRKSVRIGKLPVPLRIRAGKDKGGQTRLVGGAVLHEAIKPVGEDDPIRKRLPAEAISHVRCVEMSGVWNGSATITGPVRRGMNLPLAADGTMSELFCNGKPLTAARWPNTGFATIAEVVNKGSSKEWTKPGEPQFGGTFRVKDSAKLGQWAAAQNVWLSGYWGNDWADDTMPAGKIDVEAGTMTLGLPTTYGLAKIARYTVTNLPEELDAPGEYWLDPATKRAYFWLSDGVDAAHAELVVSLLGEPLITLDGAKDVEIAGLEFFAGRGVAVRAAGVENLRIEQCTFRDTGTIAIELDGRESVVRGCTFEDIGAGGVTVTGGDRVTLTHAGNEVRDCTFRRCGRTHRTYQPAVKLDGVGQVVANNRFEELPHFAIWFAGNEHVIELNDISRVLLETGDSGAIYCGRDWTLHGTVIKHNLFHDIQGTDARYQNAVYLDDMASGISVEGNIFVNCHWGMLIGGGRDVHIRGNVFDSCGMAMSFDKRGVGWMAKNIADPEKSTLHQRLRAVPIDKEPWRTRYPSLQAYLTDRFGRPVGGVVEGNVCFATPLGKILDRECVRVDGNVESKEPLGAEELGAMLDPIRRRGLADFVPKGAPEGFKAIPVGRIGPGASGSN
jgi:hypothetical protein